MTETELLFTEILACTRPELYLRRDSLLGQECSQRVAAVLRRRIQGEPLQYILGKVDFLGREFKVAPGVLIPRPETEILVEAAQGFLSRMRENACGCRILDLCTGSGCIAVSLARSFPQARITASDISSQALEIARENAGRHRAKVEFLQADLFSGAGMPGSKFDLIVSNPPYVAEPEFAGLQREISFEPRLALDGGRDGLDFYRRIAQDAPGFLAPGGYLLMEMGFGQRQAIEDLLLKSAKFEIIEVRQDYNGIERIISARRINS